jgi:hypothetical protein
MIRGQRLKNLCRGSELKGVSEVQDLQRGFDFRLPQYRREVFLRFYEFHLKYASHPGGVYFAMPWLTRKFNLDQEQRLWIAFINGCSQNIVTTWQIFERYPSLEECEIEDLNEWWNGVQHKYKVGSGWDLDRKYFKVGKTGFPQCVQSYKENVAKFGSQTAMFNSVCNTDDVGKNFEMTWDLVRNNFMSFGRLSTFSYLEYLRIQGLNLDCNNLFLEDMSGSKSHRNGICKVLGRDDLDWWKEKVTYDTDMVEWLTMEGKKLLEDARERIDHPDVSYFTLESTLCCYKSWYRPKRRYPNVYMDMMYNRIKYAELEWGKKFDIFWEMRKDCLPKYLRLEDNPWDVGIQPIKQNHYRETGEVILMDNEWDCFSNNYGINSIDKFFT